MADLLIHQPLQPPKGIIALSGSKSLSNRALVIRFLSGLNFTINNLSVSEDTVLLQKALEQLDSRSAAIDVNHAGTDFRFLTAVLAATPGEWVLTGSPRMKERPVGELVNVLRQLGADIQYMGRDGFPPLKIKGKAISGGPVAIAGHVSSQFISALLLVAPYFEKGLQLEISTTLVSQPYVEMTVALMKEFGAEISWQGQLISVKPGSYRFKQDAYFIEGDWSSAGYWYGIAALSENSGIVLKNLSKQSLQADSVAEALYAKFGVSSAWRQEPGGSWLLALHKPGKIQPGTFSYNFRDCPDLAPTVACTCAALGTDAELEGLQTLKIKESDRVLALKQELEKLGCEPTTTDHSLHLKRTSSQNQNEAIAIDTYHDHRMAMSFAPLCLIYNKLLIRDAGVVDKSYPGFWQDLAQTGFIIETP